MGKLDLLVEAELGRHDWPKLRDITGCAADIPFAIRDLLDSKDPQEAKRHYWRLENFVVVQGQLFEVAKAVVPVLCAALVRGDRPKWVNILVLELLFQIVNGDTHRDEVRSGNANVASDCRLAAKSGLWLFYRLYQQGTHAEQASEIIELIDTERDRLAILIQLNETNNKESL